MCVECWNDYGSPKIWNGNVERSVEFIAEVYAHHAAGGNLHVQLDDWNLDLFGFFRVYQFDTKEALDAERACFNWMKSMTEEERASALGFYDGFWKGDQ